MPVYMTYRLKPSATVYKAAALENISQQMKVAGWYITHHSAALGTKTYMLALPTFNHL